MKFAIISAGEGSRLAQEGVELPKPLVKINGEAMIDRLIRIFTQQGAEEIVVIVNCLHPQTKEHLDKLKTDVPLRVVQKTTPSSMHSFFELSPYLEGEKFCLTTVDTIFREDDFAKYIQAFKDADNDGLMAVTDYIDDEKPLYVDTDVNMNIQGFLDANTNNCKYISGGIYCLGPKSIDTLRGCMEKGMARMRNFQRQLVADGLKLNAYNFGKILDVDHAGDIIKAELFLSDKE
ncbi:MAG: NTP transferase domain-containing protein [Bacteroidales bacterium]|nr:NTP transferase domain-containing protein [Candidatus Minthousia equi]